MTKIEELYLHLTFAAVALTGLVFSVMKYAMTTDDPFAVANHPWQPYMLSIHVVFAPLFVFGLGIIYRSHIARAVSAPAPARRGSGVIATFAILPMILSGYLMQVITGEQLQYAMRVVHWISSGGFTIAYLAHQVMRFRKRDLAEVRGIDDYRGARAGMARRAGDRR